eukprot:414007-Pleurochrysis_carterae.AAC.1
MHAHSHSCGTFGAMSTPTLQLGDVEFESRAHSAESKAAHVATPSTMPPRSQLSPTQPHTQPSPTRPASNAA